MRENKVDNHKISLILNYLIFIFVLIGTILMFTGIKITYIKEPALETSGLSVFKFFTVDSNIFMGIIAILFARQERKIISGKIKEIPISYYLFKFMATVSVTLTFLTVFIYLGGIAEGGLISLLQNSNLFFHLIVPVLSVLTFTVFEKNNKIKANYIVCSLIPMLLYAIYYIINVIVHFENGTISPKYDWYRFMKDGMKGIYYVAPTILVSTLAIGIVLWVLNRKRK